MKKSEMMIGLGIPGGDDEDDDLDYEMSEDKDASASEAEEDEAIDTLLDADEEPETRREAFRRAVQLCSERYR